MTQKIGDGTYSVDPFSLYSLRVVTHSLRGNPMQAATGFVVAHDGAHYLVTNWHVPSGRDSESYALIDPSGRKPHSITIYHHSAITKHGIGAWTLREESLYGLDGSQRWIEHSKRCIKDMDNWDEYNVDVVALRLLEHDDKVRLYSLDVARQPSLASLAPGLPISIVGYPFGQSGADMFPIWKTGHMASDVGAHTDGRHFLIDATTRDGMSGSPVFSRRWLLQDDGRVRIDTAFAGVYSGRLRGDTELGIVWSARMVPQLLPAT